VVDSWAVSYLHLFYLLIRTLGNRYRLQWWEIRYLGRKPTVRVFLFHNTFTTSAFVRFTVRNITINNAATAIYGHWNWGESTAIVSLHLLTSCFLGWTFQGVFINNCQVYHNQYLENTVTDLVRLGRV
jgi:hypothetical protein